MRLFWGIVHIILCVAIVCGSILLLGHYVGKYTYSTLGEWANFATYLSLSISVISVIYIFLTYWSQIKMSSVIQFESTFFQWYQIHNDLIKDLKCIRPKEADLIFDFQDGISFCSCKAVVLLVPTHPYPALFVAVYTAAIGVDLYRDCRTTP